MTFRNQFGQISQGSVSALSMAATNPNALPIMLAAAGTAVTVGAAVFAYKEFKHYKKKEHLQEIELVNALHRECLEKIWDGNGVIQGFPAIFKLPENNDVDKVDSMHLTDEQIENIGRELPREPDIVLSKYREYVLNAILKLKAYYFCRSSKHDVTAGVICYLMNMLETKCFHFEGYDWDLAYLNALAKFVNRYASKDNRVKSQHFSRLKDVFKYLMSAIQELEKHKEAIALDELIRDMKEKCEASSRDLLKNFLKMVTKNKDWPLIKTVTIDEIIKGVLQRKYIKAEIKGLIVNLNRKRDIPDSIFKNWLIVLADYYWKALDPDTNLTAKDIYSPEKIFSVPNIKKLPKYNQNKLTQAKGDEAKTIATEIEAIRKVFKKSNNFLTTKIEHNNSEPKFVPISSDREIAKRAKLLADFAAIIHKIISLQYLSTHLLKSIKELGQIYVKLPSHYHGVFSLLDQLCALIKNKIKHFKSHVTEIQKDNENTMELKDKQEFPQIVIRLLDSTDETIQKIGDSIKNYRTKVAKGLNQVEPTVESVNHEMFEVARVLSDIYHIKVTLDEKSENASVAHLKNSGDLAILSLNPGENAVVTVNSNQEREVSESVSEESQEKKNEKKETLGSAFNAIKEIEKMLKAIHSRITAIQEKEKPPEMDLFRKLLFKEQIASYFAMYQNLVILKDKCGTLLNEVDKTKDRNDKTKHLLQLTHLLCIKSRDFLALEPKARKENSNQFYESIKTELEKPEHLLIDNHKNLFPRMMYSICQVGMFSTASRKRLTSFTEACARINRDLSIFPIG